jgi:hypothetical protein
MCGEKASNKEFMERCVKEGRVYLFEEMFWIIFELFDAIWTIRQTSWDTVDESNHAQHFFRFGEVSKELKQVVFKTLSKNPHNFATFKVSS